MTFIPSLVSSKLFFQIGIPKKIQIAFEWAWQHFPDLHHNEIYLHIGNMKQVTMRAQPVFDFLFFNKTKRAYKVDIQLYPVFIEKISLASFPEEVLVGWFAHELGHIMDYLERPWYDLIKFGIAYLTLPVYRRGAESRADVFAVKNGCGDYILTTKRYILENSELPSDYLSRINRFYLSPQEIEAIVLEHQQE